MCYVDFVIEETIYLITVYSKKQNDNLSKQERNNINIYIDRLRDNI